SPARHHGPARYPCGRGELCGLTLGRCPAIVRRLMDRGTMRRLVPQAVVCVGLLVAACGGPIRLVEGTYQRLDPQTEYLVEERPDGLLISVVLREYQFVSDQGDVRRECRSTLTSLAHAQAERRGRRLQPINDERMRLTTGRQIPGGITWCA